jgi:hypothetical protein
MRITKNIRLLNHQAVQPIEWIAPLAPPQTRGLALIYRQKTPVSIYFLFCVICMKYICTRKE